MASVIVAALLFGLVTLTTGSVLPAIIAHMFLNIPTTTEFGLGRLAFGVVLLVVFAKPVARYAALFAKTVFQADTLVMLFCVGALAGAGYAIAAQNPSPLVVSAAALAAAVIGAMLQKSPWRTGNVVGTA
jgi:hypothetical protein